MRKNGKAKGQQNVVKLGGGLFAHQHGTGWDIRTRHGALVRGLLPNLKACRTWAAAHIAGTSDIRYAQQAG